MHKETILFKPTYKQLSQLQTFSVYLINIWKLIVSFYIIEITTNVNTINKEHMLLLILIKK